MPTILKSVPTAVTTAPTADEPGTFEALVSVFGNTDSQNDVVDKGAFADTLKAWADSASQGRPLPVLWSHDWSDPYSVLGEVKSAEETDQGLLIKGALDLDNGKALQVYNQMKAGRINQFSFAATTPDAPGSWSLEEDDNGNVVQHLKRLDLIEVGPTLRGANTETQLVSIKSDGPLPKPPVKKALTDTDPDESVGGLAASLDAVLDQALALLATVDPATLAPEVVQAIALLGAADAVSDLLLDVLGVPDPDDTDTDEPVLAGKSGLASLRKSGRILAQEHVDTLKDIHGQMGKLIDTVTTTSRPSAGDEPAKSATTGADAQEQPRQQAKARLAELATRKGQK